jgi:lon-related putative ATP-dependent protease
MTILSELGTEALYRSCKESEFKFETTSELSDSIEIPGQQRAVDAVRFGLGMDQDGYNIFALGPVGTGKRFLAEHFVREKAASRPVPPDLCYVNNFAEPSKPALLRLPPGVGSCLKTDLKELIEEVATTLPAVFESEEYQSRLQALRQRVRAVPDQSLNDLRNRARERGIAMLQTPVGFVFAPMKGEEALPPEDFAKLSKEEQKRLSQAIELCEQELASILGQFPKWEREVRNKIRELSREMTKVAVGNLLDEVRQKYTAHAAVVTYLNAMEMDITDNARQFMPAEGPAALAPGEGFRGAAVLRRYQLNVITDHSADRCAPVVYENHPSYDNLIGRVEHIAEMGTLITDFSLIRAGAFHKANGGYLILDALKLLTTPYAWEGFKRVLQSRQIRIESIGQALGLVSTVSLAPEPLPLDVKVVLLGDRQTYYLLCHYDPDFMELFKVGADFDDVFERTPESQQSYARLVASITRTAKLRPFDRRAVMRLVEHSSRMSGDAGKMSADVRMLADLLRESDYCASLAERQVVNREDVQSAIDAHIRRSDRVRERLLEATLRKSIYIDTEGSKVGQVNGLSVIQMNDYAFGKPTRITAKVRLGKGEVIDIEREVELSGPIHSKGVLIITGFLGSRYAADFPLSLSASLVFEQSYSGVEGDSASSTELYALLSAISGVPIRQDLAVTGSVNQHGEVQPIGGVNEKIEGFFDLCTARGLTGSEGVLIPASNRDNLMLRQEILDAVAAGQFHIYPVETIDQGMELLTGIEAGTPDENGEYPFGTVNYLVQRRLREMAQRQIDLSQNTPVGVLDV